jgi:hypothetical protein
MQKRLCLLAAVISCAALFGQTQTPPAKPAPPAKSSSSGEGETLKEPVYVRRISLGVSLHVTVLDWIKKDQSENVVTSSPAFDGLYTGTNASRRVGFGLSAQVALTERFAVSLGVVQRSVGYKKNSDIYTGVDNPLTTADERKYTVRNEDTRAKLYDFPFLVRYYTKDRHVRGPRGFLQGGPVWRKVSKIRTGIDESINGADAVCCDYTPATPTRRGISGIIGGFGVQLIDDIGIRVVPEFRYTHWFNDTFKSPGIVPMRHQIEGMVSLTF